MCNSEIHIECPQPPPPQFRRMIRVSIAHNFGAFVHFVSVSDINAGVPLRAFAVNLEKNGGREQRGIGSTLAPLWLPNLS